MWNFTYTCTPNNLLFMCEFLSLYGLQDLSVNHEQIILTPPYLMGFFLH